MDFLCFPKALNHVLAERGIHQLDVIAVAAALDLTVPASHAAIYPFASVSDDPRTWGVHPKGNEEALRELLPQPGTGYAWHTFPRQPYPEMHFRTSCRTTWWLGSLRLLATDTHRQITSSQISVTLGWLRQ